MRPNNTTLRQTRGIILSSNMRLEYQHIVLAFCILLSEIKEEMLQEKLNIKWPLAAIANKSLNS
jgi:hypothetical protein